MVVSVFMAILHSPHHTARKTQGFSRHASRYRPESPVLIFGKRLLAFLLLTLLLHSLFTTVVIRPISITTDSMGPSLQVGDHVLSSPLAYQLTLPILGTIIQYGNPKPGDLVTLLAPYEQAQSFGERVLSFFTGPLGFLSSLGDSPLSGLQEPLQIKRIIAGPGDTVLLEANRFFIKPAGSNRFITEEEYLHKSRYYDASMAYDLPPTLPLSGTQSEQILGPGEYFVAADNRGNTMDSRHWGGVNRKNIRGKIFLRYKPMADFGLLP
ncbi:hypothetical protein DC28_00040 [Spirochaeta lutea]|uniref:Signal peptidase I n=2 Tax=Spirochaeta lutea TaxID=1480694 RepID=A0A098R0Z9_9SPIO|nr:hypothetical protein DC28_00040 [Spirochaeta lutea]